MEARCRRNALEQRRFGRRHPHLATAFEAGEQSRAAARVEMRPEPHRFATFHVLRRAEAPAVLFEAGYVSNADDELLLRSPEHRAALVAGLAETIEADVAARSRR